jgi:hypothetical protein
MLMPPAIGISDDDWGMRSNSIIPRFAELEIPIVGVRLMLLTVFSYNQGLKTDYRDDKGNYVYGEKELWYLHSIESKTMIATFEVEDRLDHGRN